jgi:hypothetical protein
MRGQATVHAWHPPCNAHSRRVGGWACVAGPSPGPKHSPASPPPCLSKPSTTLRRTEEAFHVGFSSPAGPGTPARRVIAERRGGADQRVTRRRSVLAPVSFDLRRRVDRRGGGERRSTLERRSRSIRYAFTDRPSEHFRDALQLLEQMTAVSEIDTESRGDLAAALQRLRRALGLLERRTDA